MGNAVASLVRLTTALAVWRCGLRASSNSRSVVTTDPAARARACEHGHTDGHGEWSATLRWQFGFSPPMRL